MLIKKEVQVKPKGDMQSFTEDIIELLASGILDFREYQEGRETNELSHGLGKLMAVIQYGLTSKYCYSENYEEAIVEKVTAMIVEIHKIDKKIHFTNLGNRVMRIAQKVDSKKVGPHNIHYNRMLNNIAAELTSTVS